MGAGLRRQPSPCFYARCEIRLHASGCFALGFWKLELPRDARGRREGERICCLQKRRRCSCQPRRGNFRPTEQMDVPCPYIDRTSNGSFARQHLLPQICMLEFTSMLHSSVADESLDERQCLPHTHRSTPFYPERNNASTRRPGRSGEWSKPESRRIRPRGRRHGRLYGRTGSMRL
jgi:hypothetical protein